MRDFLSRCVGLEGVAAHALGALADAVVSRRYDAGHTFFVCPATERTQPVRWVVQGRLQERLAGQVDPWGVPMTGPGALFGGASVAAWWEERHLGPRRLHSGSVTRAQGPLWVLELPPSAYGRVFAAAPELGRRLVAVHHGSSHRGRVGAALRRHPVLGDAPPALLDRLARAGRLEARESGGDGDGVSVVVDLDHCVRVASEVIAAVVAAAPALARRRAAPVLTLLLAHPQVAAPMDALARALAAIMGEPLGDETVVASLAAPTGADPLSELRAALAALVARHRAHVDHLLVCATAATAAGVDNQTLVAAVRELGVPTQVCYLVDRPDDWWERPAVDGVWPESTLPVARLGPPPACLGPRASTRARALGQLLGASSVAPSPWPLDAVRVRDDLGPWARAITHRRVGLAIGGAGAQSFAAIPLLRRILAAGVPVDTISGSSTGAFIGAWFAAFGEAGLHDLVRRWPALSLGVAAGWWASTALFELWLVRALRYVDLDDLSLPVVVVATDAETGDAVYLTSSLAGQACAASGCQPPMTSTVIQGRRLVDGAGSSDLPVSVLPAAGCDLVVGVQAVATVGRRPGSHRRGLGLGTLGRHLPLTRGRDAVRAYVSAVRQGARSEVPLAQVVCEPTPARTHAGSFWSVDRVVAEADGSAAVVTAADAVIALWRDLCAPSPRAQRAAVAAGAASPPSDRFPRAKEGVHVDA